MKRSTKTALIIAGVCLVLGLVSGTVGLAMLDWDLDELAPEPRTAVSRDITEDFHSIRITDEDFDIVVLPAEDGKCRVEIFDELKSLGGLEPPSMQHTVEVTDGVLTVERQSRYVFRFGIFWGERRIVVRLPEETYETLTLRTLSGDVRVSGGAAKFQTAVVTSTSGDVEFSADVENDIKAESTSGDVYVWRVLTENVKAGTTSGDVTVHEAAAKSISVSSTSGDVELTLTKAEDILASAVSGDIVLDDVDARELRLKTVSGDVEGSVMSAKNFVTETTSGEIRVPPSDMSAGICHVQTTSGDVEIYLGIGGGS